jgi:hypothetical protein
MVDTYLGTQEEHAQRTYPTQLVHQAKYLVIHKTSFEVELGTRNATIVRAMRGEARRAVEEECARTPSLLTHLQGIEEQSL